MDKLNSIKAEAKRFFKESVLEQKLKIGPSLKIEYKDMVCQQLDKILSKLLKQSKIDIEEQEFNILKEELIAEVVGYGILEKLIRDPEITDILVNGLNQIYIEKKGKLEKLDLKFDSKEELLFTIERMMVDSGKRVNTSSPFVDFNLGTGARVTVVIPPVSPSTPLFCIRKLLKGILNIEDLVKFGTLNRKLLDFFKYSIKARLNILITGSTGAGKSTLMNLLIREFIPKDERIVIIEDTQEIVIDESCHFIRLITRSPNIERRGEITLRDLVKLSLHLRPDRIIIGEVRGEEAFHFLHAVNTGHEGSMCTIHANNSEDALNRLETLALMDRPNLHSSVIRHFLKSGIDFIIHMTRFPSGQRVVSQVSEFDYKGNSCIIKDIFSLKRSVKNNKEIFEIKSTGHTPSFIDKLKVGSDIPADFFNIKS